MTYLQLINAVLTRLREVQITAGEIDADPFYRMVGANVNDAVDRVQEAWQWSGLRGTDYVAVPVDSIYVNLPNSEDSSYILKRVYSSEPYDPLTELPKLTPMRQLTVDGMRSRYMGGLSEVPVGQPTEFATAGRDAATGLLRVQLNPKVGPTDPYALTVDRVARQATLVAADDRLLVPALPVYSLATALSARERGEVGNTPTSELFRMADMALSDAIAQDSALYGNELDWFSASGYGWSQTNVGSA